ncbi:MAG: hypothetical protein IT449_05815 [Phycisphaerales bacterium]|nr:hypothetical protein [Phycisphaerales bacterium]
MHAAPELNTAAMLPPALPAGRRPWLRLAAVVLAGCVVLALILAVTTDQRRKQTALAVARRCIVALEPSGADESGSTESQAVPLSDSRGHRLTFAELPDPLPQTWRSRSVIRAYTEEIPGLLQSAGRAVVVVDEGGMRAEWIPAEEFQRRWDQQEEDRLAIRAEPRP